MDIEKDLKIIERIAIEKEEVSNVFNVYEKLKDELWHYDEFSEDDFYE